MNNLEMICTLITTIVGLIPTVVSVVLLVVNVVKNKDWDTVKRIAQESMTAVEKYAKEHPGMSGDDKLNMALEAVKKGLLVANISFDEKLVKKTIEYINQLCSWSKTVNA